MRIAFDRPDVLNAFRPHTVDELLRVLEHARTVARRRLRAAHRQRPERQERQVGVLHRRRPADPRQAGYQYGRRAETRRDAEPVDKAKLARLHILECQRLIRFMPKVVICVVHGWAAGGGHSLHVVCDLTLASARARAASSRPTPTSARSTAASGRRTSPARSARSSPARSSSSARSTTPRTAHRMGAVNRVVAARRARGDRAGVGPQDQRQVPDRAADAEVLLQPDRRRAGRPAAVRRRDHPAGLHDRRGAGGPRPVPREARARTGRRTPGTTEPVHPPRSSS